MSSIDLNIGYYYTELSPGAKQIYNIVLPLGKYKYQRLTMVVCNSLGIFREKVSGLFEDFHTVCLYIYDVLVITNDDLIDDLKSLGNFLQTLAKARLEVNA